MRTMVKRILKTEGIYGLYKGYSASFYSSIFYGYLYFYLYKGSKLYLKDKVNPQSAQMNALIYAAASAFSELLSLIVFYPFELIKIRLLTKNEVYKYESVVDAFIKILMKDSV